MSDAMDGEKYKCDTCEYESKSSGEHCNCCESSDRWKEAGWIKDKKIKELRTRVAELEAEAKMGNIPYKEAVKLRTRVAELEKELGSQLGNKNTGK